MKLKHSVYDTDTHFSIDPATRALINESLQKTSLIQYDHNCERFTFELPRTIEGHDMSKCDIVQVHYLNVDAQTKAQSKGVYEVDDMQISPDGDDVVICSWLIPSTATEYVGSLSFLLRFCCIADDGRTLSYAWHTAIYSGIAVSNGIYNGDIVSEEFPEILVDWQKELQANMIANVEQTQKSAADGGLNVWTMTMGDGRAFDFRVYNGRAGDVTVVQQAPQFVGSIEECTDSTRLYVLPDGHIYHYRDTTIVHPAEQETRDIQVLDGRSLHVADHQVQRGTTDHHCATDWVDLSNVPRPCHINLKGVRWGSRSATNYVSAYWAAFTSTGNYSASNLVNGSAVTPLSPDNTADYKIVNNNDTYTDVTVTIKSDKVKMVAFAGVYASSAETDADGKGGAGSYGTAEAVLYYNVSEETTETWHGWYDTGHVFSGSAGVSVQQITESTEDGGSNVVTFTDGTSLTVRNGSRGSSPVKGVDYFTAADKEAMVDQLKTDLPEIAGSDAVKFVEQTLTEEQKAQARKNIGAFAEDTGERTVEFLEVTAAMPAFVSGKLVFDTKAVATSTRGGTNPGGIVCKKGVTYKLSSASDNYLFAYHLYRITSTPSDFMIVPDAYNWFPECTEKLYDSSWITTRDSVTNNRTTYYTAESGDILLAPVFRYGDGYQVFTAEICDEIFNTFSITWNEGPMFVQRKMGEQNANRILVTDEGGDVIPSSILSPEARAGVNPNIKSINHRGYNSVAPENTLSAYRLSKKMGFDMVECDVSFTSDGYAVLLHDQTIDRTSNGTGNIDALTFAHVRSLDFGSWKSADYAGEQIPTFEEFIALCRTVGLHPYIELKTGTQTQIESLVATVKKYGMLEKVTWISTSTDRLGYVKALHSKSTFGLVCVEITESVVNNALTLRGDGCEVFIDACNYALTEAMVTLCANNNIPIEVWDLSEITEFSSASPYVSGFTTDKNIAGAELYKAAR